MSTHIDDYDALTVPEVKEAVRESDLSNAQLRGVLEYEREHKDRVTVTRWLDDRIDDSPRESDVDEPEVIRVTTYDSGYIAGHWFDYPLEKKTVKRNARIERALDEGLLEEV